MNGIQQGLIVDRFHEQGGAAGPDGRRACLLRVLGRDKDEAERRPGLLQLTLQLKAAHALHAYVGHDAGILGPTSGLQKLGGAAKDAHLQTGGPQKPLQGPADRRVVLNYVDRRLLRRHA